MSTDLLVDSNTFVITTEAGPSDTPRRMTLTLPLINRGKRVAIYVTGKHKREILSKLEMETSRSVEQYPILGVNPVNGTVSWYIDHSAYITE
uniref:Glucosamine/galactosamine-6-phosphate isomerase domain-containing protein n=1 Tax=Arion vulgaris TaxID=1028688 RepID=A0A0B7AL21_9EUPU